MVLNRRNIRATFSTKKKRSKKKNGRYAQALAIYVNIGDPKGVGDEFLDWYYVLVCRTNFSFDFVY